MNTSTQIRALRETAHQYAGELDDTEEDKEVFERILNKVINIADKTQMSERDIAFYRTLTGCVKAIRTLETATE